MHFYITLYTNIFKKKIYKLFLHYFKIFEFLQNLNNQTKIKE